MAMQVLIIIQMAGSNFLEFYSNAKQKHPRCKKSEAKSEAPVSFYSCVRLKSLISGGGQGPTELFVK